MKYLWVMLLSFVVVACGDKPQKYDRLPYNATVLAFGDSVTFGYGVDINESYPAILKELSQWNVVNSGISGEKAEDAVNRIDAELSHHQPQLVIIELGGNDFLQRARAQDVKEYLRAIIHRVKSHNAIPVLVAVPALSPIAVITGSPSDSDIYKELAKEEKINLIPNIFSNILGNESLKQDQIHPNREGYRVLAEEIYRELGAMGL